MSLTLSGKWSLDGKNRVQNAEIFNREGSVTYVTIESVCGAPIIIINYIVNVWRYYNIYIYIISYVCRRTAIEIN